MGFATEGWISGHHGCEAAITCAAASVPEDSRAFTSSDELADYSADGPCYRFFKANGEPYTEGGFTKSAVKAICKPDIAAADGVSCSATGFETFAGTSAAAPHAAAIAALMLEVNPTLSPSELKQLMVGSTLSAGSGWNRNSGYGIVDALKCVQAAKKAPVKTCTVTWNANGGTVSPSTSTYAYGTKAGEVLKGAPTAKRTGWIFGGWFRDEEFTDPLDDPESQNATVTGDATFHAKWMRDTAAVSFVLPEEMTNRVTAVNAQVDTTGCTSLPTVKVTGLPPGLKFAAAPIVTKTTTGTGKDKKTVVVTNVPANTIYGTPTAASKQLKVKGEGEQGALTPSQVKVTVTTAGKNTQTFTIGFTVLPLPKACVGTFAGYAIVDVNTNATPTAEHETDWIALPCPYTATVDAKGTLSGSFTALGKKLSFKVTGYASFDAAASKLVYEISIPLKTIDRTWTESLNVSLAIADDAVSLVSPTASSAHLAVMAIDARRNAAKDAGFAALAKPYAGTYVATFGATVPDGVMTGLVTVALSVDAKGGVKAAGTFVDATTFSASATLAVAADGTSADVLVPVTGKPFGSGGMLLAFVFAKGEDGVVAVAAPTNGEDPLCCAAKYVPATKKAVASYAAYDLFENAAYAYKANAWIGAALTKDGQLSVSYLDGEDQIEARYAFAVKNGSITGIGKTTNKAKLSFKLNEKTGLFTGANGKTKVFGALYPANGENATVAGIGLAVLTTGAVQPLAIDGM